MVLLELVLIQLSQVELSQFRAPFFVCDTGFRSVSVKARGYDAMTEAQASGSPYRSPTGIDSNEIQEPPR